TIALILLLTFCGTSSAEISKVTVCKAWKRITKADSFTRIPITYEKDKEPNAWVKVEDGGKFSVHVTRGLMRVLETEDEIAGVLGHEIGHIRLGHHEAGNLPVVRTVLGINSDITALNSGAAFDEGSFTDRQEEEADDFGTELLRKARYNPRGLYDALMKIYAKGYEPKRNGFVLGELSRERLAHAAEKAGINPCIKATSLIGMNDIAEIMLGR
ncbi:MAG: M48 family metallopeptidase, partial [Synergistaceae bacterium]|nr:M48 family metallopeptidase [Synergistaceae bacterium]